MAKEIAQWLLVILLVPWVAWMWILAVTEIHKKLKEWRV